MKNMLVIGGGAAGLSAAVTAAEVGASVTVLERHPKLGGNGQFAEGIFAAGSRLQRRLNIDADPDALFREAMEFSHWRSDARLTRALIDGSGETVDWLCDLGVPLCRVIHHMVNQTPEVFHMTAEPPTGRQVMRVLARQCRELGVDIRTETPVCRLCVEDGAVTGAMAESGEIFPADAVLIATGGFAGDTARLRELLPNMEPNRYLHLKGIYHPGDGIRLAEQAGGAIDRDIAIEGAGPVFPDHGPVGAVVRCPEVMWVNILGERFADESIADNFIFGQNALARQPEKRCFAIFDDGVIQRLTESPPSVMAGISAADNGLSNLRSALDAAIEDGLVVTAEECDALARKMGISTDPFFTTFLDYNLCCIRGYDPVMGKAPRYLRPLTGGRLYAAKAGLDMITTHGGIRVDSRMRVLGEDYYPIPGLYAAGIDISGVDSGDYSVNLSGHAFGFALCGGRLAAKEILGKRFFEPDAWEFREN